jgi:hypothetical protein
VSYDPVPDLAQLLNGMTDLLRTADDPAAHVSLLGTLALGPYARLRGGLLLDEPGYRELTAEQAIRLALDEAGQS